MKIHAVRSLTQMGVALVATVAVLCCPAATWSMTGGLPQNSEPGWSAKVFLDHAHYICSGELIAPRWVLTAGHCTFGMSSDYNYVHIRGVNIPATLTVTDPNFKPGPHTELAPSDVGLLELPVDAVTQYRASVLPLATPSELISFENRGVTIFGYGRFDNSGLTSPVLRKSPDGAWTLAPYCQVPEHVCFLRADWATSNNIEPGDSGGAWVGWRNGGWRLLAVLSGHPYYYVNSKLTFVSTPIAGMSPTTPAIGSWIQSVIAAPAGAGSSGGGGSTTPGSPQPASPAPGVATPPSATVTETSGSVVHTWTDYSDAGGTEGPEIQSNDTVQIACKVEGFRVQDGNTWWYLVASSPWNSAYYASADAFYNNGQTSGSLIGTPFVDPAVPNCSGGGEAPGETEAPPQNTLAETSGSVVHTWSDYTDAGGSKGPEMPSNDTVQIACKINGFTVADGNTWWYRIASAPWNGDYYGSADAFYNNGETSGSLLGTPYVDPNVPNC